MKRAALFAAVSLSVLFSLAGGLASRTAPSSVATQPASRSFDFTSVTHIPALPEGTHRLRIWVPLPYEDKSQLISKLQIVAPVKYKIERDTEYGDKYAYFDVDSTTVEKPFDIRVTFHAERFEHRVALASTSDLPITSLVSTARFLQPDRLVPINGVITELSAQQTKDVTLPVEKARRIYEYVVSTMRYDKTGTGWGRGDAIWACDSKRGNCTDFHSVFIGMARAAGIPARFEIGFPLPANAHEGAIPGYHCWAQFYVDGIGWIPVDASEAWKNPDKHDYFFGATDQNRVMMSLGRDIRLKPAQKGDPLNYFVYPYAELDGHEYTEITKEYSFRDDHIPGAPAGKTQTSD
jgi:transglutaminase-like putative cysteine protease